MTRMRRTSRTLLAGALLAISLILMTPAATQACPNCKQTLAEDRVDGNSVGSQGAQAAAGFNYSVLFMIGSVYLVAGSLVGSGIYYIRKHSPRVNKT